MAHDLLFLFGQTFAVTAGLVLGIFVVIFMLLGVVRAGERFAKDDTEENHPVHLTGSD